MIVVIPIRAFEAAHFEKLAEAIVSKGPLHRHTIILNPAPSVVGAANGAVDKLCSVCHDTRVVPMLVEPKGGPDELMNRHFQFMIRNLSSAGNGLPFFWLGVNFSPIAEEWADSLEAEYLGAYKPFMGREEFRGSERYIANPLIMPANIMEAIPWWPYLGDEAFDLQWRSHIFINGRVTMQIGEPTQPGVKIAASRSIAPPVPTALWLNPQQPQKQGPLPEPDIEAQFMEMVHTSPIKLRMSDISERMNLPAEQLLEIADRNGLEVKRGGWVIPA